MDSAPGTVDAVTDRGGSLHYWNIWWSSPLLLKLVDLGLISTLIVAPFFMGGRQALGQLVLCALSCLTAVAWSLHQWRRGEAGWRFTGVEPVMLLGVLLIVIQCCQLTPELVGAISPRIPKLLSEWSGAPDLLQGEWNRISLTPNDTQSNLVVIVASMQFFFIAVQRLSTTADLCFYIRTIALGGGVMALFGLVQWIWGNGKFFWIYDHPMTDTTVAAKGAFSNANHFAHFLALALPAQLFQIVLRLTPEDRPVEPSWPSGKWTDVIRKIDLSLCFWAFLLIVTGLGILCSSSLIGILSASMGILLALVIFWHRSLLTLTQVAIGAALLMISLSATPFLTASPAQVRTGENVDAGMTSPRTPQSRAQVWEANLQGIREFPLAGTGLGSHHEVYWMWFLYPQDGKEYSHAENGYLQIALETGLTGLGLVLLLWLSALMWCAQGLWNASTVRTKGVMAVVTAGLLMNLLQSMTDFVWYVPACVNIVLLYGICAWRISLMRFFEPVAHAVRCRTSSFQLSRLSWIAAVPCTLVLGGWMVHAKLPELAAEPLWDEYLRLTLSPSSRTQEAGAGQIPLEDQKRRIELALAACRANPNSQRLQLHAGLACLNEFAIRHSSRQHHMPLSQIRDAARSLFISTEEMDQWLNRPGVLGAERQILEEAIRHFRKSLYSCPLQPRPYLELAELVWLEGAFGNAERRLVEQAVTARPCDARSRFALGRLLWLDGEFKAAADHWKFAFRLDAGYRGHLIASLADYVPARFFLDYFEPDHDSLKQLRQAYRTSEDRTGYRMVLESLAQSSCKVAETLPPAQAEQEWILAHECYAELGDNKAADHAVRMAVAANPTSFAAHQKLGLWLYQNGFYAEAFDELSWCLRQRPQEGELAAIAIEAHRKSKADKPPTRVAEDPGQPVIR
jgi:Lipid A core - O-antigen ligase and related enzymes